MLGPQSFEIIKQLDEGTKGMVAKNNIKSCVENKVSEGYKQWARILQVEHNGEHYTF